MKPTPSPSADALRAQALRMALGAMELDHVRSIQLRPRTSARTTESGPRKIPSLFNPSAK